MSVEDTVRDLEEWIARQVRDAGAGGVVIGLSGGLDSSVVAALSKAALGDRVLGVIMPCGSACADEEDAELAAIAFGIPTLRVDLQPVLEAMLEALPRGGKDQVTNLKPRLRMAALYFIASVRGYIVAGTSNRSEMSVGYFTKYGDSGADIYPIGNIFKSDLYPLAEHLGVPRSIIEKPPSAGLWEGQTDEGEIGMTYIELDGILKALGAGEEPAAPAGKTSLVRRLISASEHKRRPVPIFEPAETSPADDTENRRGEAG